MTTAQTTAWRRRPIRIERHRLGPRVHVLGKRVHEYQAGLALLAASALVASAGAPLSLADASCAVAGAWLVIKDWPDLFPATRDTASWRLGIHRAPFPARRRRPRTGQSNRAESASTTSPCSQVSQP